MRSRTWRIVLVAGLATAAAVAAVPGVSQAKGAKTHAGPTTTSYYLSMGDSYSVGYQPGSGATSGYTGYVATKLKMTLENFGCGGATTASILSFDENYCGVTDPINNPNGYAPPAGAGTVGPLAPGQTQVDAADAFIAANPGKIGLVTVSIGGNDVTPCAAASPTNPVNGQTTALNCVAAGLTSISTNLSVLVGHLSSALLANGDSSTKIIGLTYPDVLLGLWVYPTFPASAANQLLASQSQGAFFTFINPALKTAYTAVPGGRFADVTTATKGYTPLTKLAKTPASVTDVPSGTKIPKAVAEVCTLTWYCQLGNIHANTLGYNDIGKLVVKTSKH